MKALALSLAFLFCSVPLVAGAGRRAAITAPKALGYRGFNYGAYLGYKVVPGDMKPARLPTIVKWMDAAGKAHQTHMRAGDLGRFGREVLKGGRLQSVEKATPGMRWVPSVMGEY